MADINPCPARQDRRGSASLLTAQCLSSEDGHNVRLSVARLVGRNQLRLELRGRNACLALQGGK